MLFADKKERFTHKYERFASLDMLFADKKEHFPHNYKQFADIKH